MKGEGGTERGLDFFPSLTIFLCEGFPNYHNVNSFIKIRVKLDTSAKSNNKDVKDSDKKSNLHSDMIEGHSNLKGRNSAK